MTFSEIVHWRQIEFKWVTVAQTAMRNNQKVQSSPLSKFGEIGMNEQIVVTFRLRASLSNYASVWNIWHTLPELLRDKREQKGRVNELTADWVTDFLSPCFPSWISVWLTAQQVENNLDVWGPPRAAGCRHSSEQTLCGLTNTKGSRQIETRGGVTVFRLKYCFSSL